MYKLATDWPKASQRRVRKRAGRSASVYFGDSNPVLECVEDGRHEWLGASRPSAWLVVIGGKETLR